jgi:hypothetical protein
MQKAFEIAGMAQLPFEKKSVSPPKGPPASSVVSSVRWPLIEKQALKEARIVG